MYVKAHDNACLVLYKTKNPEHSEDAGQDLGTALLLSPFFWVMPPPWGFNLPKI
jgi:hypothetical protein